MRSSIDSADALIDTSIGAVIESLDILKGTRDAGF